MSDLRIAGIQFEEEGVTFQFMMKTDVRKEGALQLVQTLFVGAHPDYRDGLDDLISKAEEVLRDALEDYGTADVVDLALDDDDDDDLGMGF